MLLGSALLLGACEPRPRGTAPMPPSRLDEADAGARGVQRGVKERPGEQAPASPTSLQAPEES
jgi:hypothetical protein